MGNCCHHCGYNLVAGKCPHCSYDPTKHATPREFIKTQVLDELRALKRNHILGVASSEQVRDKVQTYKEMGFI